MADSGSGPVPSVYPDFEGPYRYEDAPPVAAPPPAQQIAYQEQGQPATPLTPATPTTTTKSKGNGEVKPRLRKACDSCSVRKVKCDESGPPCKSCASLDIPCTFNRPSRRRGPPNRHAEAVKRQRLLDDGSYNSVEVASPTAEAAYGLAALSAPMSTQLSAETICDIATLNVLIDDYFTYIHPLIPIPHEPTFREQFARREDQTNKSFLALVAGMIECLVTSFPRRVKQVFVTPEARAMFPNASVLIGRCHFVFSEARGKGFLDREDLNLYDACGSYLAGLSLAYMYDLRRWRLYCSECVIILRTLNYQKADDHTLQQTPGEHIDYVEQQSGRRLFWLCFVGSMTVRQLGSSDSDVIMPHAHSDALPPLPVEVDDKHIVPNAILGQPQGEISRLVGFNYNIKIYRAFHAITAIEMAVGANRLFDWERQRAAIRNALRNVKAITRDVPSELRLEQRPDLGEWPPRQPQSDLAQYTHLLNGRRDPTADQLGLLPASDPRRTMSYPRRTVQFEVQKANIYGSQLATRSYLVERYWNLYEIYQQQKVSTASPQTTYKVEEPQNPQVSPTVAFLATGFESRFQPPRTDHTPSESAATDDGETQMALEREDIVRDMARLLKAVNQVNMEPNGHSFCDKIRQVASTLLYQDRSPVSSMNLDAGEVQEYLRGFIDILSKLERIGTSLMHGGEPAQSGNQYMQGQPMPQGQIQLAGIQAYAGKTQEEIEEEELVQWASLKEHQERFVMKHEGYLAL
ncbi:hypothetical protein LTR05_008117 [Lithohypha guttulata]|uniref:Xylanolytic transcriptional activator xlnR n=1 Tax=Lithohypha guttulata TaxID=1690604 RepID=A0AAN7STU5_9EURO|nr:hypothetical protein LTR05_008117 [Lithohypha guttulata]